MFPPYLNPKRDASKIYMGISMTHTLVSTRLLETPPFNSTAKTTKSFGDEIAWGGAKPFCIISFGVRLWWDLQQLPKTSCALGAAAGAVR